MSNAKRTKQPGKPKKERGKIKLDDLNIRKETLKQLTGGEAGDVKGGMRRADATDNRATCLAATCLGGGSTGNMPC